MALGWQRKFKEPIVHDGGRKKLATLGEAAQFISRKFGGVTRSATLEAAVDALITAAETGKALDIATAKSKIELVLRQRHML